MTYRGSYPSGYDGQNGQQWAHQSGMQNYGSPSQLQYQQQQEHHRRSMQYMQYQNSMFGPAGYPQQPIRTNNFTPVHANHFQTFDPSSFNQPPQQTSQQYGAQMGQSQSQSTAQQPAQQPAVQPVNHQYAQQFQQQRPQHYPQQQQQQMLPPNPSPMSSYQPTPQQARPTQQLHQYQAQQVQARQPAPQRVHSPHINSPVMAQPSQYPHQSIQKSNRDVGATTRVDQAGRITASPRLTSQGLNRSSSVSSTRSPVPAPGLIPHNKDTTSLLICVAEELLAKARSEVFAVAENPTVQNVQDYQKLIATGLGCLETVLNSNKVTPQLEAKLQLRYATILCEETNNIMEGETALTKGITLCEKYRFHDMKYLMQFLQLKMLSRRKGKAAMIAVDGRIADAELLKHYAWAYALRFFKASMYIQSSNPADVHALDNLRAIMNLAQQRGDTVVFILACLLEALSLLKNMKDDSVLRIQGCISQVQKYQLDPSVHLPQLDILALMLDFVCSLHQKSPGMITQKLAALERRMDSSLKDDSWSPVTTEVLIPIKKQPSNQIVISQNTCAIVRPGDEGDNCDYLTLSLWSKIEAFIMTYTYSGMGSMYHQTARKDVRVIDMWDEAHKTLVQNGHKMRRNPTSLLDAIGAAEWRRELKCYLQILRGLYLAAHCRWADVKVCVEELETLVQPPLDRIIGVYSVYLAGVRHQGTGDLDQADRVYSNPVLSLDNHSNGQAHGKQSILDVRILAAFNRIWIMQHPERRNDVLTNELLDQLRPFCSESPSMEIRLAWNIVLAATQTNPPMSMTAAKNHLGTAVNGAKQLGDIHSLSMALNLMRDRLFQNIVGDQALKSAKAAAQQAKKSGNVLWMSVADGLLSQSHEFQGDMAEAQKAWLSGAQYATDAFRTDVPGPYQGVKN